MFDIGGIELLVIGVVALIVVGPKDLPRLVRSVGQWVGRARGLAREFQSGMEEAARQADLDEVRKVGDIGKDIDRDLRDATGETRRQTPARPQARSGPSTAPSAAAPEARSEPVAARTAPVRPAAERPPAERAPERLTDRLRGERDADDVF